jgi:uncharacterized damage-inducible protein DinB
VDAASLAFLVGFSNRALSLNLEGLTHDDALVQPAGGGNCVNWLLGHLLVHRNRMLEALGEPPSWTSPRQGRYDRGSEPITGEGEEVERLETLREELDRAHQRVMEAIQRAGDGKLAEPRPGSQGTVGQFIGFLAVHEGYHAGQVALMRRAAGKEPAIR